MSKPLIAIVGRPNVGKSMLFNKIIGRRLSIVEDTPGVTRDRIYGESEWVGRKFRLVDHLAGELTDAVAGVLLVSEDVACLSTTLTYFAQALRDGADYAVCNAVFGFSGQTALYQSHGHLAENKFALVSRGLLARCRAAARWSRRPRCRAAARREAEEVCHDLYPHAGAAHPEAPPAGAEEVPDALH